MNPLFIYYLTLYFSHVVLLPAEICVFVLSCFSLTKRLAGYISLISLSIRKSTINLAHILTCFTIFGIFHCFKLKLNEVSIFLWDNAKVLFSEHLTVSDHVWTLKRVKNLSRCVCVLMLQDVSSETLSVSSSVLIWSLLSRVCLQIFKNLKMFSLL